MKAPDVSDLEVELEIRRFEQDLFQLDTNNLEAGLSAMEEEYPILSNLYFGQIMGWKQAPQGLENLVNGFVNYPEVRSLYDTCMILYEDFSPLEEEFESAFKYFKYYFPERATPQVNTFISEYSISNFIYGEDQLAVGLDFFLGNEYPYEKYNPGNPNFSQYLVRTFNRDHLVMKTLKPLVEDIVSPAKGGRLIDLMIQNGKQLYLMDLLLPNQPDSVILEMSQTQVDWLADNELEIWAFLLKENMFYESDWSKIRKFVEYSPAIPAMHPEAPGRTANWVGWQVIKAYMKNNPEASLQQLLAETDPQRILDRSKYKPPR